VIDWHAKLPKKVLYKQVGFGQLRKNKKRMFLNEIRVQICVVPRKSKIDDECQEIIGVREFYNECATLKKISLSVA
jgi:hypothetical protein